MMGPAMENTDRESALREGRKHYTSTTPCRHGHVGLRYVSNHKCVECLKFKDTKVDTDTPRGIARAAGLPRYMPANPCRRGHVCERYVANNRCVECDNLSCRSAHPTYGARYERTRKHNLKALYGITPETFDQMLATQHNRCAICATAFEARKQAHVDHDHQTGRVRGLLCTRCNMGIGYFKENVDTLLSAVDYISRHSLVSPQQP